MKVDRLSAIKLLFSPAGTYSLPGCLGGYIELVKNPTKDLIDPVNKEKKMTEIKIFYQINENFDSIVIHFMKNDNIKPFRIMNKELQEEKTIRNRIIKRRIIDHVFFYLKQAIKLEELNMVSKKEKQ